MNNSGSALPLSQASNRRDLLPYLFAFLFFIISVSWTFFTNQTWDDDGITRFFLTQDAAVNPVYFLDSWVRPLFTIIFYWPIKFFGRVGLSVTMAGLVTISALLLFKALKKKGLPNAITVIPFLLFGTFLFGISRDAMTEPLAAIIIATGIYFLYNEKYFWFAIAGSLLPLARTETIFLIPFWAFPLVTNKKLFYLPLLATGLVIWWLGWWGYTGDVKAFFHDVFKSGHNVNRYGHTELTHHIGKYIYVLGPVCFFYFTLGYITHIKTILKDYFILLQFTWGFVVYVIFSSFLDLGQSGGALRNLITLSPFAAVISVYGLNYWMQLFNKSRNTKPTPVKSTKTKGNKQPAYHLAEPAGKVSQNRFFFAVFVFALVVIAMNFFTNKLQLRQSYNTEEKDYTIFLYLLACVILATLPFWISIKNLQLLIVALFTVQVAFTLFYESPQSHNNDERTAITAITSLLRTGSLKEAKVYTNQNWFFWSAGAVRSDSTRYASLDSIHLMKVKPGEILLWEPHYNGPNYSNIPLPRVLNDTSFAPFYYINDEKKQTRAIAFVKLSGNVERDKDFFDRLIKEQNPNSQICYLKGNFEKAHERNITKAIQSYSKAIELDGMNADALYERAVSYLSLNDLADACYDAKQAALLSHPNAVALSKKICGNQRNFSNMVKIK